MSIRLVGGVVLALALVGCGDAPRSSRQGGDGGAGGDGSAGTSAGARAGAGDSGAGRGGDDGLAGDSGSGGDASAECEDEPCSICENHWAEADCRYCPAQFTVASNCQECSPGWSGANCEQEDVCVRYVDPETDGKHLTGYSWSEAFATIDDALDSVEKSGESCEIWVREGIYDEELHLRGKVALYGGFSGDEQSLSERDPEANPVVLTRPVWGGGAVDSVTFRSVVLSSGSALTVRRAKFLGDDTQLSADEEETLVEDSVFDDMSTGVIYSDGGDITVRRCRISGSSGTIAVNTSPATIRFEDSFIVDNETSTALFSVYRGKLVLQNTVVAGNVTAYSGADLFSAASATVEIVNSTIVDNVSQAGLDPGPTFYVATANLRVFNTIVWGNGRDLLNGPYGDVVVEHSVIEGGYEGSGNLSTAPTFLDSDAHPYRLAPGSIGIDAGTSVGAPELDLVGDARFDDPEVSNTGAGDTTYVDIGAYEAH